MAKEAFLPLFFGDFLASTAEWEGEERALYLLLLGYQWSLGSLPIEPRRLCKLVGWDQDLFDRFWPTIACKLPESGNRRANARLEQHRERSKEIADKRAIAGAKGGEATKAVKAKQKQLPRADQANAANLLSHPSHPIPSQSEELSSKSSTSSLGGVGEPRAKRSAEARGTRISDPFLVTAEMRTWAADRAPHVNLPLATEEFCNYWRSKPGKDGRKLDWVLTWKNRMLECESKATRANGSGVGRKTFTERMAVLDQEIAQAEGKQ